MSFEQFLPTVSQNTMGQIYVPDRGDELAAKNPEEADDIIATREAAASVYQVALPVIFGIIIVLGVVGNILVIYVIASRRKLRTVTNVLLMNLAIADILFLVVCGPLTAMFYAMSAWALGNEVCRMVQYVLYVTCYVTVYTLVAIAVVRYLLVVKGGHPTCVTNTRSMLFVILGIWGTCLLINIPVPLSFGTSITSINNSSNVTVCSITCEGNGQQRFFSLFFGFAYIIPLLIIASFYFLLVRHLVNEQRRSMIRKPEKENGGGSDTGTGAPGGERRKKNKSSHVTRVLILVVAVFALCWLPLHIHLLWDSFGELPYTFAYKMCVIAWHTLVFLNSALNPIIYNFASSEFRDAFHNICDHRLHKEGSTSSGSGSRALLKSQNTKSTKA